MGGGRGQGKRLELLKLRSWEWGFLGTGTQTSEERVLAQAGVSLETQRGWFCKGWWNCKLDSAATVEKWRSISGLFLTGIGSRQGPGSSKSLLPPPVFFHFLALPLVESNAELVGNMNMNTTQGWMWSQPSFQPRKEDRHGNQKAQYGICNTRRLYKSEGSIESEMILLKGADRKGFMANSWTEPLKVSQAELVTHESIPYKSNLDKDIRAGRSGVHSKFMKIMLPGWTVG